MTKYEFIQKNAKPWDVVVCGDGREYLVQNGGTNLMLVFPEDFRKDCYGGEGPLTINSLPIQTIWRPSSRPIMTTHSIPDSVWSTYYALVATYPDNSEREAAIAELKKAEEAVAAARRKVEAL